jgi:hypothetical protein
LLVGLLDFSSTLKMEALCSSETSVATQQTTRRHIPEDDTLHNHRCENLKSYRKFLGYISNCQLFKEDSTEKVGAVVTHFTCIQEVIGSNLGRDTGSPD